MWFRLVPFCYYSGVLTPQPGFTMGSCCADKLKYRRRGYCHRPTLSTTPKLRRLNSVRYERDSVRSQVAHCTLRVTFCICTFFIGVFISLSTQHAARIKPERVWGGRRQQRSAAATQDRFLANDLASRCCLPRRVSSVAARSVAMVLPEGGINETCCCVYLCTCA